MIATFIIPDDPVGKARPRVTRFGTYTPKKTLLAEEKVKAYFKKSCPYWEKSDKAIKVSAEFIFKMPKYWSKKKKTEMLGKDKLSKPDNDNCLKLVLDALNDLAYKDDSQVTRYGEVKKIYGEQGLAKITLEEI